MVQVEIIVSNQVGSDFVFSDQCKTGEAAARDQWSWYDGLQKSTY